MRSSLIRKYSSHLQIEGIDLLRELFEKKQYSFEDFYKWFDVSVDSPAEKEINVRRKIKFLIDECIIHSDNEEDFYELTDSALIRAVELVNSKFIQFGLTDYYEKELLSVKYLYYFIEPFSQKNFYRKLQELIGENLFQVDFWEDVGSQYGQLISFIRAEEYYEKVTQAGVKITPHYSSFGTIEDVQSKLKDKGYISKYINYHALKNHFQRCFDPQCRICGKNIINLVAGYVEEVTAELRSTKEFSVFMDYLKRLPFKKTIGREEKETMKAKIDDFIQFDEEKFGKSKRDTIFNTLSSSLKLEMIGIIYLNREILEELHDYRAARKEKKSKFSNIEHILKEYKKSISNIKQILDPHPLLGYIDSRIGKKIDLNKKTFQNYNKSIRKLGREGEKRIYEGLEEIYQDHLTITPVWNNKEKEAGLPYDILLENTNGNEQYIEVKTTHTNQRSFIMSENEFDFAMKHSDNYKLYLVVNIGQGADSYKVVINNFKETYGDNKKIVSRRLTYD